MSESPNETGKNSRTALAYSNLNPRDPSNFTNPLKVPRPLEGLFGIIESPSNASIKVKALSLEVVPSTKTDSWVYEVNYSGRSIINPIFKMKREESFSATLTNEIPQETIIHWHGLIVDWKNDGQASYAISQNENYDYGFTVYNRGGTYWYHPHPHLHTAEQIYKGLASFFIVEDRDEENLGKSLDLELGKTDIPLLIQDKLFNEEGRLEYDPNEMERIMGFYGDLILVNLTPNPSLEVDTRIYRFRVLNGSSARIYRLAFTKGNESLPFHIIGVDAGLLERPFKVNEVFVAPAERVDLLLDVRHLSRGDVMFLKSLQFDAMERDEELMEGMMEGMVFRSKLQQAVDFNILKLLIRNKINYDAQIPETLSMVQPIDTSRAIERKVALSGSMNMKGGLMVQWMINGEMFDMNRYSFQVDRNVVEIWNVTNPDQSMPHPVHIHGYHFQVIERLNSPAQVSRLAVDASGRLPTDLGWKDTLLIWPGEKIRIAVDFANRFAGEQTYPFHCHNLEHEDAGMMINYKVA